MALACDLRIARADAQLGPPRSTSGSCRGGGGTQRAPRLVAPGRARWLIISGERILTRTAEAWGLVESVVDDLDEGITRSAEPLSRRSPHTLRRIKSLLQASRDSHDDEREVQRSLTHIRRRAESVPAFLEKREARWTGRSS